MIPQIPFRRGATIRRSAGILPAGSRSIPAPGSQNWLFRPTLRIAITICFGTPIVQAGDARPTPLPPPADQRIDFNTDIKPILEHNCLRCHNANRAKGGFRLDNPASAWRGGDSGPAIIFGNSSNSLLIHYVAQLDPENIMPPPDQGDPLTAAQVSLLRAWIDQGAWWGNTATNDFNISFAPTLGFVFVHGNEGKFAEHHSQREGWRGGVESFSLSEQLSPDSRYTLSGRALTDDYRVELLVEKPALGFYHFGFEQTRYYDADTGGYFPAFTQPTLSLNHDLHLDVGRAWLDFGLTVPDWPRLVLGYEYQFRYGEKSTLQWGAVGEGANTRNIYPAYKFIDERTHILKFDIEHNFAGWQWSDSFRGEWSAADTRQENVSSFRLDTANALVRDRVTQGWQSFQGANTFRVERAIRDWCYASGGYLYSHLAADADFSLDTFNPAGTPVSSLFQRTEWRSQRIVLERESHVGNLNLLLGPWQNSTLNFGIQGEWTRQNGTVEGETTDFIAPPFNGPPFNFPDFVNPISGLADIDRAAVAESAALRINQLPFTTLFAEARLQQEQIQHTENYNGLAPFFRNTEADSNTADLRAGFDTSPRGWLKLGAHYRWRDRATDYDDGYPNGAPADITGYPTLISARDLTTHEMSSYFTLRPTSWAKTTFTYRLVATDSRTTTEPTSFITPGDASPGGRVLAGNYDAQIFSLNFTITPTRRLHAFSTISFQDTRSISLHDNSTAVAPYRGETWSVLCHGRYVLTAKTDLTAGYTFSTANFQQDNFAASLPLGMHYDSHALQAGLTSRCTENLTTKLQYGFYQYNEPGSGQANDYTAHAVFVSLHWRLN